MLLAMPARAMDIHWAKPVNGSWSMASNWSPAQVPGAADRAFIDAAGASPYTVTLSTEASVGCVIVGTSTTSTSPQQSLTLVQGSVLTLGTSLGASQVQHSGLLGMSGTVNGGDLHVYGTMLWSGGTINGTGTLFVGKTGILNLTGGSVAGASGDSKRLLNRRLVNDGLFTWGGSTSGNQVDLVLGSGSVTSLVNEGTGIVDIRGSGSVSWNKSGTRPTVTNSGILRKSTDTGEIPFTDVIYNTNGQTEVHAGALTMQGSGISFTPTALALDRATYIVDKGAEVRFDSDYTLNGASMTGPGTVRLLSGTLTIDNTVDIDNFQIEKGALAGSAPLNVHDNFDISPTAPFNMSTQQVNNLGHCTWDGDQPITLASNSVFVNDTGADCIQTGNAMFECPDGTATFLNRGLYQKTESGGTGGFNQVRLTNSGEVQSLSGVLQLGQAYVQVAGQTDMSGGSLLAKDADGQRATLTFNGGRLTGTGNVSGNVLNRSHIAPGHSPGEIVIQGNFIETANGVLDLEIAGSNNGQYDYIDVQGVATLDGTVNVTLLNQFVPPVGASFEMIDAVVVQGTFASYTGLGVGSGKYLSPSYTSTAFSIGTDVDSIPPTVTVATPTQNGVYNQSPATTNGGAADDASGIAAVTVALAHYPNGDAATQPDGFWNWQNGAFTVPYSATNHEITATGTTSWSKVLPVLTSGFYGVRATASDLAGNSTASPWVRFNVPSALHTISGRVTSNGTGLANVSLTRTGSSTAVLTNSNGDYSFTNVVDGNYTITPSLSGTTFSPASKGVTINGADVTQQDFTATPVTRTISGIVTNNSGTPMPSVIMTRTNGANVVTDSKGAYTFPAVPPGTYTIAPLITPALQGVTFTPASQGVAVGGSNLTNINFQASFTVTGKVVNSSGTGLGSILVSRISSGGAVVNVFTDANGNYIFMQVRSGSYTIAPQTTTGTAGMTFFPTATSITVKTNNLTNINFSAFFTVSGKVTISNGVTGIANVLVRLGTTSSSTSVLTDANGNYKFTGVRSGSYTITPTQSGKTFNPVSRSITVANTNLSSLNFIGS